MLLVYSLCARQVENLFLLSVFAFLFLSWQRFDILQFGEQEADAALAEQAIALHVALFSQRLGLTSAQVPLRCSIPATAVVDFSEAEAVKKFNSIRLQTNCLFAASAKLWGNDWNEHASGKTSFLQDLEPALLAVNVALTLPRLLRFCLEVRAGSRLDGFVFEIRGSNYSSDLHRFSSTVKQVLSIISAADPSGIDCIGTTDITKRSWYFHFAKEPFFITTFAPFYSSSHPRYQFEQHIDSCFILLQPEESFLHHKLPPDKPKHQTNWNTPTDIRDRIRSNFKSHGREYLIPESSCYSPADFIVAPLNPLTDPPVRFWL